MDKVERAGLIKQLDQSFQGMPYWAQVATKHAMGSPAGNSFLEVIKAASDETLLILRDDFEDNGDLLSTEASHHG